MIKMKSFKLFNKKKALAEEAAEMAMNEAELKLLQKKRLKIGLLATGIFVVAAALVITIIVFAINRKNTEGLRNMESLAKSLGSTTEIAARSSKLDLKTSSSYDFINAAGGFSTILESKTTIRINGTEIPSWLIFCNITANEQFTEIVYSDYTILQKNLGGIKKTEKVDVGALKAGMTKNEVHDKLEMEPVRIVLDNDGTKVYTYKYYYKDKTTKEDKSYYIIVRYNFGDKVEGAVEEEDTLIQSILSLR